MNRGTLITAAGLILLAAVAVYAGVLTAGEVLTIVYGVVLVALVWFVIRIIRDVATIIRKTAQRMRSE